MSKPNKVYTVEDCYPEPTYRIAEWGELSITNDNKYLIVVKDGRPVMYKVDGGLYGIGVFTDRKEAVKSLINKCNYHIDQYKREIEEAQQEIELFENNIKEYEKEL